MVKCTNCQTDFNHEVSICTVCRYPIKGTDKEQATFIAKQVIHKSDVKDSIEQLKKSRMILFGIGAFYLVTPFTPLLSVGSNAVLIWTLALGLIFTGFAFLTYKKPLLAIGIPLGLTILYYLFLLYLNPIYVWTGILWKTIILAGLGYGFYSVHRANKVLKNNPYLAKVLGYDQVK